MKAWFFLTVSSRGSRPPHPVCPEMEETNEIEGQIRQPFRSYFRSPEGSLALLERPVPHDGVDPHHGAQQFDRLPGHLDGSIHGRRAKSFRFHDASTRDLLRWAVGEHGAEQKRGPTRETRGRRGLNRTPRSSLRSPTHLTSSRDLFI